jgi:hypothetical protein
MKYYISLLSIISISIGFAQPNTEVFLFDLEKNDEQFILSNIKNISNNEGYDNQPSFLDDNTILYAGTRNGQTDIAKYNINYDSKIWINHTDGSEYSPLLIPNQKAVSSIRLEKDGTQKLYLYSLKNGESDVLVEDIIIGYQTWYNDNILVSAVLEDDWLSLYSTNLIESENYKVDVNIGRSLHKIPDTELISYISKQDSIVWEIKSFNPLNQETRSIAATLHQTEDMCWLPDGTILMGKEDVLYKFRPNQDVDWIEVASLKEYSITNITRLAVNSNASKLALIGEGGKPEKIDSSKKLEAKLENIAWIAGNWKGEAFGGTTEENWSEPSGGSMMATFKVVKDDKVMFYELEIIREVDNTLLLQLKHFNNDLKGWETKDDTVDFPLKEITSNKVVFDGMTFEKISDNEMNVYVDMHQKDGSKETMIFNYTKQ